MSLVFSLSPASEVPIYRQIIHHIQRAAYQGQLKIGEQLPAVRVLAEALVVNPNTVARAYQDLIRDGLVESRAGVGVFVAERRQVFSEEERRRRLHHGIEQLLHEAFVLNFTLPEVQEAVKREWQQLQQSGGKSRATEE